MNEFKLQLQDLIEERVLQAKRNSGRRLDYHCVAREEDYMHYKSTGRHFRPTLSVIAGNETAEVLGDFLTVLFDIIEYSSCHFNHIQLIPTYANQGSLDVFPLKEISDYIPSMLTKEGATPLSCDETLERRAICSTVTIVVVCDMFIVTPELYYAYDSGDVIWVCINKESPCHIIQL